MDVALDIDLKNVDGPIYLAIANAFAELIESGETPAYTQLLPQRELARRLGVTVGTINRAYDLLKKRQLVDSTVGRGTFVRALNNPSTPATGREETRNAYSHKTNLACFRIPVNGVDKIISDAAAEVVNRGAVFSLQKFRPTAGLLSHRKEGAEWLSRYQLEVAGANVLVCGSGQLALNAIVQALVPDDGVLMTEDLTYAGLRALGMSQGVSLLGIETDEHGIIPDALDEALRKGISQIIVLQPTLQNPTASSMPLERRMEIAKMAEKYDLVIIEDDIAAGMIHDRLPPIASLAPRNTVYLNSVSKCISPALRLGYIAAQQPYLGRVERALQSLALCPPAFIPDIMSVLITSGEADRIVRMTLEETNIRNNIAQEYFTESELCTRPGSFFGWLKLPANWSSDRFVSSAMNAGVLVNDGDYFRVGKTKMENAVRVVTDGAIDQSVLRTSLTRLKNLLQSHSEPDIFV
ncbi:PLP-dependent aminotransferase family protein [Thalassospiraceae bacterium LMO-JJ14]|nr:PLP-dependent aminotransferase family protein [Thalassospiraceae bacterium LMO-JJ14]